MTEMLDRLKEAQALIEGANDNTLRALAAIAAHGGITIIPRDNRLTRKPVIVLPQRMYDRLLEIIDKSQEGGDL